MSYRPLEKAAPSLARLFCVLALAALMCSAPQAQNDPLAESTQSVWDQQKERADKKRQDDLDLYRKIRAKSRNADRGPRDSTKNQQARLPTNEEVKAETEKRFDKYKEFQDPTGKFSDKSPREQQGTIETIPTTSKVQ